MLQMLHSWWLKLRNRDYSDNSVTVNETLDMSEIVTNQIQNGTEPKSGPDGGPEKKKKTKKLGHEELLRLLSVFEGELQGIGFILKKILQDLKIFSKKMKSFEDFEDFLKTFWSFFKFFDDFEDVKKSTC